MQSIREAHAFVLYQQRTHAYSRLEPQIHLVNLKIHLTSLGNFKSPLHKGKSMGSKKPFLAPHAFSHLKLVSKSRNEKSIPPIIQTIHHIDAIGLLIEKEAEGQTGILHLSNNFLISHRFGRKTTNLHYP